MNNGYARHYFYIIAARFMRATLMRYLYRFELFIGRRTSYRFTAFITAIMRSYALDLPIL